jgi:TolB-like protein
MICSGCKAVSTSVTNVNLDVPYRDIKTLAVMRLNDEVIQEREVKGLIVKTVTNPDAGELLAGIMTSELARWGKYRVISRSEIKDKLSAADAKENELVKWRDYTTLGKVLKVDAVVIGEIDEFGLSTAAVYQRGSVSFNAECIDTRNGKVLWSLDVSKSVPYKDEVELANNVMKEVIEKLKKDTEGGL